MTTYSDSGVSHSQLGLGYSSSLVLSTPADGPDYILYTMLDRRKWIMAPNFVRTRHRYRGYRESAKINLEIHSMTYDLKRIKKQIIDLQSTWDQYLTDLVSGVVLDLTSTTLTVEGLDSLNARVANVMRRIQSLE